jgi:hypothetical protein
VRELGHAHVLERGEVDYRRFRPAPAFALGPLRPFLAFLLSALSALSLALLSILPVVPVLVAGTPAAFGAVAALGAFAALGTIGPLGLIASRLVGALGLVGSLRLLDPLLWRLGPGLGLLGPWLLGPGLLGPGLVDGLGLLDALGPVVGWGVGWGAGCGRSSLTISVHRSVMPSPVAADTGRTGAFSCLVHVSRARRRSARESLSIFVATTAAVSGWDAVPVSSFRAAWVVKVRIQSQAATSCGRPGWRASTSCNTAAGLDAPPK